MKDGADTLKLDDCVNEVCPWSGKPVQADSLTRYQGHVVGFCNPGCKDKFEKAVTMFDCILGSIPGKD
jgi:YHS domain-containing protein